MRFSKSLLMMFAGLGLFACSNNDDIVKGGTQFDGPVDVAVKINLPGSLTRSIDKPSEGNNGATLPVAVESIEVALEAGQGGETKTLTAEQIQGKQVTFEHVENPRKVSVKVNYTGEYAFKFEDANDTYKGLKAPMYGESGAFTTVEGVANITVNVEHKLARLEIGGIKHVDENVACIFTENLKIAGSFLQGVEGAEVKTWEQFQNAEYWDKFEDDNLFEKDVVFPKPNTEGAPQCIAYNVDGGTKPIFTLAFDDVQYTPDYENEHSTVWVGTHGYAIVNTYKIKAEGLSKEQVEAFGATYVENAAEYEIEKFPAGYIYRVTSLEVPDSAIKSTIEGEGVNVVATVDITPWIVVDGEIEWK